MTRSLKSVVLIVLTWASVSYGWQNQVPSHPGGNSNSGAGQSTTSQTVNQPVPQYEPQPQSLPGHTPQPFPQGSSAQEGYPQYPYPPYHNPYYGEGITPRDLFSNTLDWLFGLPSNIAERVSNFVDSKFFPQAPATQGGPPQSHIQGTPPSPDNTVAPQSVPPAAGPAGQR
ncbi:MAG TPA: hypothetical protein VK463_14485 [Desulfomonilaceae bacterium]|nr:hypothetical protein [Desulfomonilaceae bacterium]